MGISGLLQFINEASESVNVKKYKGQTVAVDTYCWLHKGAFSCAEKLAKGEPTHQYVTYCMKFVDMLLTSGVKPILIFDGCNLPSKKEVEKSRRERRQANLQKGKQLLREGRLSEARDCFTRCVNVTPAMAHDVIKAARARGVDCIVAPYEADAQLAFLNKSGIAQVVITEDSDLLAFGCKKVLLKMDKFGNGLEIDQACLGKCKQLGDVFTEEKFRYMCILSGCDYLASIPGIGLAKACKLLKMANNPDIIKVIKKIGQYLKMSVTVPDEYIEGFTRANNTFLYQLVFDPISRRLVPLNPYPDDIDPKSLSYAGHHIGDKDAFQIALGNVDINNMERIDDYNPDTAKPVKSKSRGWNDRSAPCELSVWSRGYTPAGSLLKSFQSQSKTEASPEKPSTKGLAKVISTKGIKLPSREKLAKRAREENGISETDLLSQYSFSGTKRFKKEEAEVPQSSERPGQGTGKSPRVENASPSAEKPGSQPRVRNRFATLLQRRNQEEGDTEVPVTRSRFFSNSSSSGDSAVKQESAVKSKKGDFSQSETPDLLTLIDTDNKETESRKPGLTSPSPQSSPSPSPSGRGTGIFGWSGSLAEKAEALSSCGISSLQQFHRKKDSSPYWGKPQREPSALLNKLSEEDRPCQEAEESDNEDHPRSEGGSSPQSQGTVCLSQDSLTSSGEPPFSQISQRNTDFIEIKSRKELNASEHAICSPELNIKKSTGTRIKVSGLLRDSPAGSEKTSKIKLSGPAKASGLSKRSSQKKKVGVNDENKPGLQVTISDLWKNFGFKKEKERVSPAKKAEPMSPVKDNIQALTPDTDKDIFNNPECSHVQRAILC
ncbi:exonuclease 1-like [Acipenser oxyrinchus oxyrinchus]|uniref:Exonuclease 1 n=1 Tax=Acipenser oxyrinchus oxyrinchus TaxID=40147 RepID=A0AAD8GAZ7_ACIOX|nr:exonuclease 1-like [Acipenser oxyrinchus oxyrinchus]